MRIFMRITAAVFFFITTFGHAAAAPVPTTETGIALNAPWKIQIYALARKRFVHPAWGWQHSERDYNVALSLAKADGLHVDEDVLFAASFLHDMAAFAPYSLRHKGMEHGDAAALESGAVLQAAGFPMEKLPLVQAAERGHMYYSNAGSTPAAIVLHDADSLDFLGTVGAARMIALTGEGSPSFGPAVQQLRTFVSDIPPRLITPSAKRIGVQRAAELQEFLTSLTGEAGFLSFEGQLQKALNRELRTISCMSALRITVLCFLSLLLPAAAQTVPTMSSVLRSVFALRGLSGVGLSPNGDAVVWEESLRPGGLKHPTPKTKLFVQRIGGTRVRISAGNPSKYFDDEQPVWSSDGSRIAFFSDAQSPGQLQIFIADANGRNARRLTQLTGAPQALRWSPDDKTLAMLYIAHPHRKAGALAAGARNVGVIGTTVDEQQLALVNAATGAVREITPANAYVYEYGWAPDSKRLAYTYAYGSGDNNWWIARLAWADTTGHAHDLLRPSYQINDPQWSPDGTSIAIIGGLMSDFGSVGGDVYLVNVASGTARDVAPGMPVSAASLRWIDNATLYVVAHSKGAMYLYRMNARTGAFRALTNAPEAIRSWDVVPRSGRIALVRESFNAPAEIWTGSPTALRQLTHVNAGADRLWGPARSLQWKNEGFNVQGWLVYPLHYDSGRRYPMVTIIHGGPGAESLPGFGNRYIAALASHGYFVFEPNPRGSFGQGERFTRANIKDFGYGDWRDDLSGIDATERVAPIDPQRLGLFGWSDGGYMGMWAETQTTRFKAIVAGAGVVNWQSYYGQNDIDQWMIPFFGASVYQDPQVYAKSSPITFIEHSKTPVLILQGERDEEVPAPQAFEFYHAMQALHVPSQLVVYADEGHGPRKPANQIDILTRTAAWFAKYLH